MTKNPCPSLVFNHLFIFLVNSFSHGFTYGFVRFMTEDERQDCVKYCERNRVEFDGRRVKVGIAHNEPGPEIIKKNAERREAEEERRRTGRRSLSPINFRRPARRDFSPPGRNNGNDSRGGNDFRGNDFRRNESRVNDSRDNRTSFDARDGLTSRNRNVDQASNSVLPRRHWAALFQRHWASLWKTL